MDSAQAPRPGALAVWGDRCGDCRLCARAERGVSHPRLVLRARAVRRGTQFRPAHRFDCGLAWLHSVRRLDQWSLARDWRGDCPVLAGMDADRDRARDLHGWAVRRRLYPGPQISRRERGAASGLDDVRDVCIRLPVRLRRAVGGGAGLGRARGAATLCAAKLSRQHSLHRRARELSAVSDPGDPRQLALSLEHTESFAREDFLSGPSNTAALALVETWPDWPARAVVLVGPAGSGKSHLASIWAARANARFLSAPALKQAKLPAALANGALVVEDLAPGAFDERALFHLINLVREEGAYLLLTAASPPAGWPVEIPDLASRLKASPVVMLAPPDDALLRAVLVKLFADRQLAVDEPLVGFLATRIERTFQAARAAVAKLDQEAMQRKRPLTRALAAEVLREREEGP